MKCSSASVGGKKMCTSPPRTSATNAVVGAVSGSSTTARSVWSSAGNVDRTATGSASNDARGGRQLIESSGSRRPAGESPSSNTMRPRRSRQFALAQPCPSSRRCSGSTYAAGEVMASSRRASSAARPVGVSGLVSQPRSSPDSTGSPAGIRTAAASRLNGSS
ncbi:Uncharacterised protein [Mycobacterium tuberculosis]|nr:Uncharacterised protein [Mycobacterium tuberculosis]